MRKILCLCLIAMPFAVIAQRFAALRDPIPPTSTLLQVGDNIVLIHALDEKNQSHKWVSFDSSLNFLGAKKLVSPDWESMVSQSYLAINNSVIRIDQLIFEGSLYITLFRFDALGNLINKLELGHTAVTGNKLAPLPFYVSFSSDKKKLALMQAMSKKKDELTLSAIVLTDQLGVVQVAQRSFAFDMLITDMLPPMVDTEGNVFVPVIDKFDSYRLNTELRLLSISNDNFSLQWKFDRKKLRDVRLKLQNNEIAMTALYSDEESKIDVAGSLYATLPLSTKTHSVSFFPYDDAMKKSLSKKLGTIGRKGNPLNNLYLLPSKQPRPEHAYGVLLTETTPGRIQNTPSVANASAELDKVKRQVAMVNSLVGTRRRGQSSPTTPMSYAEASTQAAVMERTIGNGNRPIESEAVKDNPLPEPKKENMQQLVYFSHSDTVINYQFLKLRLPTEPFYEFFTYAEVEGKFQAIHYLLPSLKKPVLTSTSIGTDGKPVQKTLLQNKHKLLVGGYPTLVYQGRKLIAIYEDRYQNEMGVVAVDF